MSERKAIDEALEAGIETITTHCNLLEELLYSTKKESATELASEICKLRKKIAKTMLFVVPKQNDD